MYSSSWRWCEQWWYIVWSVRGEHDRQRLPCDFLMKFQHTTAPYSRSVQRTAQQHLYKHTSIHTYISSHWFHVYNVPTMLLSTPPLSCGGFWLTVAVCVSMRMFVQRTNSRITFFRCHCMYIIHKVYTSNIHCINQYLFEKSWMDGTLDPFMYCRLCMCTSLDCGWIDAYVSIAICAVDVMNVTPCCMFRTRLV